MFKIVAPTPTLLKFINGFNLNLSEPQMRHVIQFMDALLACEGTKTIAKLNWLILDATDQSAFTDFFYLQSLAQRPFKKTSATLFNQLGGRRK